MVARAGARLYPPGPEERMDFHELNGMTVAQLREVASGIDGVEGATQMRKAKLLEVICEQLHIDMHDHHDVLGIDKAALKQKIAALKARRVDVLASGDSTELKRVRRKIHRLKRAIRRATV